MCLALRPKINKNKNMKYNLYTLKNFYSSKGEIEKLKELGFTFVKADDDDFLIEGNPEIEFSSLMELQELVKDWEEISISSTTSNENNITINNLK